MACWFVCRLPREILELYFLLSILSNAQAEAMSNGISFSKAIIKDWELITDVIGKYRFFPSYRWWSCEAMWQGTIRENIIYSIRDHYSD